MIVVDTNVIVYLWLNGEFTEHSKRLLQKDSNWHAPLLWRSEFRNVLTLYLRKNLLPPNDANEIMMNAEAMLRGKEYTIDSVEILTNVKKSTLSTYDLEFIVLAKSLNSKLVTLDKKILTEFPKLTKPLSGY